METGQNEGQSYSTCSSIEWTQLLLCHWSTINLWRSFFEAGYQEFEAEPVEVSTIWGGGAVK